MATHQSLADRTTLLRAEAVALSSSDRLGSLVSKTYDLLGQLQRKELGSEDLEFGLQSFEAERELVKRHDRIPTTPLRTMVYGLVETLYGTVEKMKTEGRIKVKEDNTLLDESKSTLSGMKGAEGENSREKEPVQPSAVSTAAAAATAAPAAPPPPSVHTALVVAATSPPAAAAASAPTASTDCEKKRKMPLPMQLPKEEPIDDISEIVIDTIKDENVEADETAVKNEEMPNGDAVADGEIAGDVGDFANNMHNDDRAQSEMPVLDDMRDGFENEGNYAMMNDPQDNEMMSEDGEKEDGDMEKDSSDMDRKRRSSRKVCKPAKFTQESETLVKRRRTNASNNMMNTAPKCLLCEVCPPTLRAYMGHLYSHHRMNLSDLGVYLLCACGAKFRHSRPDSQHTDECARSDYTVHKLTGQ